MANIQVRAQGRPRGQSAGRRIRSVNILIVITTPVVEPDHLPILQATDAVWKAFYDQPPDEYLTWRDEGQNAKNSLHSVDMNGRTDFKDGQLVAQQLLIVRSYSKLRFRADALLQFLEAKIPNRLIQISVSHIGRNKLEQVKAGIDGQIAI
jgi:hypothetical protein